MATSTRPGDVLASRYRLIDLLSESGGGRFWRAHDAVLERYVALHVISEDDPRAPGLIAAARASAQVLDPRILRVLDAESRDGLCFVVNEWGTGTSLDILVATVGPLRARPAAWLVAEVAGAISSSHAAGVAHGRLNPENVLIDRRGAVRIIGLSVDAALHGLPPGKEALDRADLGGLLYCALTGRWPGPSASQVAPAHRAHGSTMAPRQVLPGVPRTLDLIWREVEEARDSTDTGGHRWRLPAITAEHPDVSTAGAISDRLVQFVGDVSDLPDQLAASILPINEVRPVSLPAITDPPVRLPGAERDCEVPGERSAEASPPADPDEHDEAVDSGEAVNSGEAVDSADRARVGASVGAAGIAASASGLPHPTDSTRVANASRTETDAATNDDTDTDGEGRPATVGEGKAAADLPTEAGMPVFGEGDDVAWMRARATPPPPPPPFEEPPERPLFAPERPGDAAARRARAETLAPTPEQIAARTAATGPSGRPGGPGAPGSGGPGPGNFWPWDSEDAPTAERARVEDEEEVPGRSWLRLAMVVGLALALLVAVVVAFNLGRGRTPLGGSDDTAGPTRGSSPAPSVAPVPVADTSASDFDPLGGDGVERPDTVAFAVDGDLDTAWRTDTYTDQFGTPLGLKTGVGIVVDLGEVRTVTEVELDIVGSPADVELSVSRNAPQEAPGPATFGEAVVEDGSATITAQTEAVSQGTTTGRYLLVWFTSLPPVEDGYRVEVSEVVVRGH